MPSIRSLTTRGAYAARRRRLCRGHINSAAVREAAAVVLICLGAMTLLSLASFHPTDISLNASGSAVVLNWIGPAGAYWADLLLQTIGIGAWASGGLLLLAGCRAFAGRVIVPGLREAIGGALLMLAFSTVGQLMCRGQEHAFAPGGVAGALIAEGLLQHFAGVGAYLLAISLTLVAISLTAEGVLCGWGVKSFSAARLLVGHGASLSAHSRRRMAAAWATTQANRRLRSQAQIQTQVQAQGQAQAPAQALAGRSALQTDLRMPAALSEGAALEEAALDADDSSLDVGRSAELGHDSLDMTAEDLHSFVAHDELDAAQQGSPNWTLDTALPMFGASASDPLHGYHGARHPPSPVLPDYAPVDVSAATPPAANVSQGVPIVDVRPPVDEAVLQRPATVAPKKPGAHSSYTLPPTSLLDYVATVRVPVEPARLQENAERLTRTLMDYGIDGYVREIRPGPVVTLYEYVPGPGIKLSKIVSLADDLAMSMEAMRVRIVAPIPGKGAVGIEIPNDSRETVYLKEIIAHATFEAASSPLTMALGKDIEGNAYVADLARMPHLLVAGATGAGKSVSINAMIMSILFKATPDEVRMLMIDPKMLELSVYEGIPHLLLPVVTDPKKAALALRWATEEMERRYELLSEVGVRGIEGYNIKVRAAAACGEPVTVVGPDKDGPRRECEPMPYLLVVVDELADLMMVASREVESSIMRLAQMARAAGIHLILATQRPSVDVLTGVIKANFPTRIAFQVASRHDSRTIIDGNGAEHLLGRGDMLYLSPGVGGIKRVHGAYVSEEEIERAVAFVRTQGAPQYDTSILAARVDEGDAADRAEEPRDEMYDQAVAIVAETRQASISMIQRRLRIGYNRAARIVERMEVQGVVGPADGAKQREVLVSSSA